VTEPEPLPAGHRLYPIRACAHPASGLELHPRARQAAGQDLADITRFGAGERPATWSSPRGAIEHAFAPVSRSRAPHMATVLDRPARFSSTRPRHQRG
jgi:hypothetical protein